MNYGDPLEAMKAKLREIQPELAWTNRGTDWETKARAAVSELIGVVDEPWVHDNPVLGPVETEEGYIRQRIEFMSHSVWEGRGWLLTPLGITEPRPAVVCLPGHGKGADAIIGLIDEPYQANFAVQCVRQGWVTLAVEQVSFGVNRSNFHADRDSSCVVDSMVPLHLGETVTGWRVRDAMAALRALSGLEIVDEDRIATLGISGGGLTAFWGGALEPRFRAVGVSGYFCTMLHSILGTNHCPDNYVPGFARLMDIPDLAGLIAPRWLAVESGTRDTYFGAEGFIQACNLAKAIYAQTGTPERFTSTLFEGDHEFRGETLLDHFHKAFAHHGVQNLESVDK